MSRKSTTVRTLLFESDWLASDPFFYNEKTGRASRNINDVIDFDNIELDPEGFNNYLDFGYSVFGQTPVRHVKFLRHSSRLWRRADGCLEVELLDDPAEAWMGRVSNEDEVLERLEASVRRWEDQVEGEIIIPTSGGFDSRLLNVFVRDKSRVRTFTFGTSEVQSDCYDVVHARELARILGTRWEQVEIGDFHDRIDDWYDLYGVSTNAHGMYQMEFHAGVRDRVGDGRHYMSGIIGDLWAGTTRYQALRSSADLERIGFTHGMRGDPGQSLLKAESVRRQAYWEANHRRLEDARYQVLALVRLKIILLSYLLRVPQAVGFRPWSPYLDIDIALGMLTLPPDRRRNRRWQVEFFRKQGVYLESMKLQRSYRNTMNRQALERRPLKPLDVGLLREVVRPAYVEWINRIVATKPVPNRLLQRLLGVRKVGGALRRIGINEHSIDRFLQGYCAYMTLKPVEMLLSGRGVERGR